MDDLRVPLLIVLCLGCLSFSYIKVENCLLHGVVGIVSTTPSKQLSSSESDEEEDVSSWHVSVTSVSGGPRGALRICKLTACILMPSQWTNWRAHPVIRRMCRLGHWKWQLGDLFSLVVWSPEHARSSLIPVGCPQQSPAPSMVLTAHLVRTLQMPPCLCDDALTPTLYPSCQVCGFASMKCEATCFEITFNEQLTHLPISPEVAGLDVQSPIMFRGGRRGKLGATWRSPS